MNNKYRKLLSDTALFMVSNFASKALVFLLLPLYTNILTTYEYGVADLMTATINLLYPLLTLSIAEAMLRFAFESTVDKRDILSTSFWILLIGTGILCVSKKLVALISPELGQYWFYFCLMYLSVVLQHCFSYYTRGVNKTRLFAVQGLVHTVVMIALNICFLVIIKIGLLGYLLSITLSNFVSVLFMIVAGKYYREMFSFKINRLLTREMIRYSVPMIPTVIAWWIMQTSDKYMIIWMKGLELSGIYSVAYKIPSILAIVTSLFAQAWQISAISNYEKEDNKAFVSNVYKYYHLVGVLACAVLVALSKIAGKLLYGKEFFVAWRYVPFLLMAYLFSGLTGFLAALYTSSKKTHMLSISTCIGAAVNIVLNVVFIRWLGAMGAAVTTMIGFFITWAIRLAFSGKIIKLEIRLKRDLFLYLLLIGEILIVCFDLRFKYVLSAGLIALMCVCQRQELADLFRFAGDLFQAVCHKFKKGNTNQGL